MTAEAATKQAQFVIVGDCIRRNDHSYVVLRSSPWLGRRRWIACEAINPTPMEPRRIEFCVGEEAELDMAERPLGLIGRDRVLVDKVLGWAHRDLALRAEHTDVLETSRGGWFDVRVGGSGEAPSHVVRVTVELAEIVTDP